MTEGGSKTGYGRLYGIGVGPGDPELLTLKAHRILQQVPLVCVPQATTSKDSFALGIVRKFLNLDAQEVMRIRFPTNNEKGASEVWRRAACEIAERLKGGQDAAFITEGDPMLYSTFSYVLKSIRADYPGVPVEIVPGRVFGDGGCRFRRGPAGNPRAEPGRVACRIRHQWAAGSHSQPRHRRADEGESRNAPGPDGT